jgi:hypothetical protein
MSYPSATVRRMKQLRGIELRYVLTMYLVVYGPATIAEMIEALAWHGFCVPGRASWEIGHDRVRRRGRGLYGPAYIPHATEYRIHQRVLCLRQAAELSLRDIPAF